MRKGVEQVRLVAQEIGLATPEGDEVAGGDLLEERKHLVTNPVPPVDRIDVRGVDDRLETQLLTQTHSVGAPKSQDRLSRTWPHRREPVEAAATKQVEQDGLGLIVSRVPGGGAGRERPESGVAGPGLEVGAGGDLHAAGDERGPEARGGFGDHGRLVRRPGPEAVVDVHCRHLAARRDRQGQESEGVGPTGDGTHHGRSRSREGAAREQAGSGIHLGGPE